MIFIWLLVPVQAFTPICSNTWCPPEWKGDYYCDFACMFPECGFDSNSLGVSDCAMECTNYYGCNLANLGNKVCDSSCNNVYCGYDHGDCEYCSQRCKTDLSYNGKCDEECNTKLCNYDNGACQCYCEDVGQLASYCYDECSFESCRVNSGCECYCWDADSCYDPCSGLSCSNSPLDCGECTPDLLENDVCDAYCDFKKYDYDNGRCVRAK